MVKVKVDLDWHPVAGPTGQAWRCKALDCVFLAFPATAVPGGWRLTCYNTHVPGSTLPIGDDGELRKTFKNAPVYAAKEDCFIVAKRFITTQLKKTGKVHAPEE